MSKINEQKGWSKESTQNKLCEFKVRAISLDFSIAQWLDKNLKFGGLKDCFEISQLTQKQNIPPKKLNNAKKFVIEFFEMLKEQKQNQKLIRYIRDYTACFGPKRIGSNILINKFNDSSQSMFQRFQAIIGEDILPKFENDKNDQKR